MRCIFLLIALLMLAGPVNAQNWVPDLENGTYKNPVLFADYSDPDVIRVGDDFYMVASSFNVMPGIPVLHSKDLVNWTIINHVYDRLPFEKFDDPSHGNGSWAPSIRYHDGTFYVYFCTPHEGLFVATTDDPASDWTLHQMADVALWEDPSPLWDDDGNAYLVRSKMGGNVLYLHEMSPDGKELLTNGTKIYQDKSQPTIEGPKFKKRNGYYYILAPAGGVPQGWQTVLRSKDVYGPYEAKNVLHQGNTDVNGPHQGGLVGLESGEWWFLHFQSRPPWGRVVHLQPARWENDWPLMGVDQNDDGIGEPVQTYEKPDVGETHPVEVPQTTDEFNSDTLGLQWQWHANPKDDWYELDGDGTLQLNAVQTLSQRGNMWHVPNLLLQKFPAPSFQVTTKMTFDGDLTGDKSGLVVMGESWGYVGLTQTDDGLEVGMFEGERDDFRDLTQAIETAPADSNTIYLRVSVNNSGIAHFSYSPDNEDFTMLGKEFKAQEGVWIGAKVGLFSVNPNINKSEGSATFDWFRFSSYGPD